MIIIRFQGGLGNQLFQYALYKELQYLGKKVYADLSIFEQKEGLREYELYKLGIKVDIADPKAVRRMCPPGEGIITKIIKNTIYRKHFTKEKNSYKFERFFLECDDQYLIGYWQTEKYFQDIKDQLRNEIRFAPLSNKENITILDKIHSTNSISVHMRFGDYISNPIYDNICTDKYYMAAIKEMRKIYKDAVFYIISDDIERAKKLLNNNTFKYISWNKGKNSYYDMKLISQCRHNILANSSFSWWGTWLNENKGKTVIAPSIWLNNARTDDIELTSWIKISPEGKVFYD